MATILAAQPIAKAAASDLVRDLDLTDDIVQAIANKANDKLPFGISGIIGKSVLKKKLNEIRIVNSKPKTQDEWRHVHELHGLCGRCGDGHVYRGPGRAYARCAGRRAQRAGDGGHQLIGS